MRYDFMLFVLIIIATITSDAYSASFIIENNALLGYNKGDDSPLDSEGYFL